MGALDPADPVEQALRRMIGVGGTSYNCPDVTTIDVHIMANLRRATKIEAEGNNAPRTVAQLRADVDRLLARRQYVWWMGLPCPDAPGREL